MTAFEFVSMNSFVGTNLRCPSGLNLPAALVQKIDGGDRTVTVRQLKRGSFSIFQLDATAYPGNSGSPVFDAGSGEVIGITNMVFIKGSKEAAVSQPSGITYAIPENYLKDLLLKAP